LRAKGPRILGKVIGAGLSHTIAEAEFKKSVGSAVIGP
jgi:hypothetical protein